MNANEIVLEAQSETSVNENLSRMKEIRNEVLELDVPQLFGNTKQLEISWMDAILELFDQIEEGDDWEDIFTFFDNGMDLFSKFESERWKYD